MYLSVAATSVHADKLGTSILEPAPVLAKVLLKFLEHHLDVSYRAIFLQDLKK